MQQAWRGRYTTRDTAGYLSRREHNLYPAEDSQVHVSVVPINGGAHVFHGIRPVHQQKAKRKKTKMMERRYHTTVKRTPRKIYQITVVVARMKARSMIIYICHIGVSLFDSGLVLNLH
jgi:hypothetical protein